MTYALLMSFFHFLFNAKYVEVSSCEVLVRTENISPNITVSGNKTQTDLSSSVISENQELIIVFYTY